MRRMTDAVHLTESRCDGSAHGGCENACSLYWKEQWLKRVDPDDPVPPTPDAGERVLLPLLVVKAQKEPFEDGEPRYSCQATEMLRATPTAAAAARTCGQYGEDVTSGNAGVAGGRSGPSWSTCFNRYQDLSKRLLPAASCASAAACAGASCRGASPVVVPRPSTSTSSPASSSGSSRARRSWRRSTPTS